MELEKKAVYGGGKRRTVWELRYGSGGDGGCFSGDTKAEAVARRDRWLDEYFSGPSSVVVTTDLGQYRIFLDGDSGSWSIAELTVPSPSPSPSGAFSVMKERVWVSGIGTCRAAELLLRTHLAQRAARFVDSEDEKILCVATGEEFLESSQLAGHWSWLEAVKKEYAACGGVAAWKLKHGVKDE